MSFSENYTTASKALAQFRLAYEQEREISLGKPRCKLEQKKNAKTGKVETRLHVTTEDGEHLAAFLAWLSDDNELFINNKSISFFSSKLKRGDDSEQSELTPDVAAEILAGLSVEPMLERVEPAVDVEDPPKKKKGTKKVATEETD